MDDQELPTSPDGTDWGIYGDSAKEQWQGMIHEALLERYERSLRDYTRPFKMEMHEALFKKKGEQG